MSDFPISAGKISDKSGSRPFDRWNKGIKASIRSIKYRIRLKCFALAATALAKLWIPEGSQAKLLIIPDCFGRLANRLTVLANVIAYAKVNDAIVVDVALRRVLKADCFDAKNKFAGGLLFAEEPPRQTLIASLLMRILRRQAKEVERLSFKEPDSRFHGIPILRGEDPHRIDLDELSEAFECDRHVVITGVHVDATPPPKSICDELRALIRPNERDRSFVDCALTEVESGHVTVGVHVRHGDYRKWQDGRFFHPFDEYVQCMQLIQDAVAVPSTFLVVSDAEQDLSLCSDLMNVRRVYGSEEQDLELLTRCDMIIATHSSFANWASFHGRVPVLTVREGLKFVAAAAESKSPASMQFDVHDLKVVDFPTLQPDYIV